MSPKHPGGWGLNLGHLPLLLTPCTQYPVSSTAQVTDWWVIPTLFLTLSLPDPQDSPTSILTASTRPAPGVPRRAQLALPPPRASVSFFPKYLWVKSKPPGPVSRAFLTPAVTVQPQCPPAPRSGPASRPGSVLCLKTPSSPSSPSSSS